MDDTAADFELDHSMSGIGTSPTQLQDVKKAHNISSSSLTNAIGVRAREHTESARRSMREQEEQLAALHKENFNLKLRVYFLEEREAGNAGGYDACSKQNVELKIEVESLKNDLDTKQELLQQAAQAIELMEENQRETKDEYEKKIQALENRLFDLEDEMKTYSSRTDLEQKAILNGSGTKFMVAFESSGTDISEEFYKKQNAIVDLENKVYELQAEILARDTIISEVEKKLDAQTSNFKKQEVLLEQRDFDMAQLQTSIAGFKTQISELQNSLETKDNELKAFRAKSATPPSSYCNRSGGEPNLIQGNYADPAEVQHLRDLLAKRNSVIKKHEDAHRCACKVIQTFMQKNKEMTRQLEKMKKQHTEVANTLPLLGSESDASSSSNVSPLKLSKTHPSHADSPNLSEDAKHEREAQNKDEIESLEKFYKVCLQNKGESVINFKANSSQNEQLGANSQKISKEAADIVPTDYLKIKDENRKLFLQLQELQNEIRNTPERDNDNTIRELQKEVEQYKKDYDKIKLELQGIQKSSENLSEDNIHWQDVCMTLKEHLEELAGFLMSLLKSDINMSMMSDKIESIRNAVDKSLDLSRSVSLSVSGVCHKEGNSLIQLSSLSAYLDTSAQSGVEKLSSDSGHDNVILDQAETISNLQNEICALKKQLHNKHSKQQKSRCELDLSESEAWSEPDKNVSMSRIGLKDLSNISPRRRSALKSNQRSFARKLSMDEEVTIEKLSDDIKILESRLLESEKKLLEGECASLKADNEFKQEKLKMLGQLESLKLEKVELDNSLKETMEKLATTEIMVSKLRKQINELNDTVSGQKSENEEIVLKLKLSEDKLNALQLERDVKEADAKFAEQNLRHLQKDMKDFTNKYLDLKSENEKNSASLAESLQVNEELCEQILSLREDKQHLVEEHQNEIRNLNKKFDSDLEKNWVAKMDFNAKCMELENILIALKEKENIILYLENNEERKLKQFEEEFQNQLRDSKYKESDLLKKFVEKEAEYKAVCKQTDSLTLQMSQITIDRTRISNEKIKLEKENTMLKAQNEKNLSEMQLRISELERANAQIQNRLITLQTSTNSMSKFRGAMSEASSNSSDDGREVTDRLNNSSPDLGIESDPGNTSSGELASIERPLLKSLELTQSMSNILDLEKPETVCESDRIAILEKENVDLRQKLGTMRRTLKEALGQILAANKKKKQVEKEITAQLSKTHGVLRQVRSNLESGSNVNT